MTESSRRPARAGRKNRDAEPPRTARKETDIGGTPAAEAASTREQSTLFEKAIALFHKKDFAGAKLLFEKASEGPAINVKHSARTYLRVCEQRLAVTMSPLRSAEDHYNYAVTLLNERKAALAEPHLLQAVRLAPNQDYVYYSLALCYGLQGDIQEAYASLKRAIELQPRNRLQARSDPDFAEFIRRSPLDELVLLRKGGSF